MCKDSLIPRPSPNFPLLNCTASEGKQDESLGTRLVRGCIWSWQCVNGVFTCIIMVKKSTFLASAVLLRFEQFAGGVCCWSGEMEG